MLLPLRQSHFGRLDKNNFIFAGEAFRLPIFYAVIKLWFSGEKKASGRMWASAPTIYQYIYIRAEGTPKLFTIHFSLFTKKDGVSRLFYIASHHALFRNLFYKLNPQ